MPKIVERANLTNGEFMSSNERIWHKGPPPHVGWWNASLGKDCNVWRWWNGREWSHGTGANNKKPWITAELIDYSPSSNRIKWTDYWPENARVPRIKP
jgi:hypothetical protein